MSERGITRREVIQRVTATLGGAALIGGDRLLALAFDDAAAAGVMTQGVGSFAAADVAFLDEVAETILPETTTPGAKAAKTGERDRQVFRDGMRQIDDACRSSHGAAFTSATPAERLALLEVLDREQKTAMEERSNGVRSRAPASASAPDVPAHYFRMMKELALLGYFTSEIGYTRALRYLEAPGRYDPCAPLAPGDKSWAGHA
jgi:hypothetical protein